LTVDDTRSMREMVSVTLRGGGFDVVQAEDGVTALKVLRENDVDVTITDLNMPNTDGLQLEGVARQPGVQGQADPVPHHPQRRRRQGQGARCRRHRLDREAVRSATPRPGRQQDMPLTSIEGVGCRALRSRDATHGKRRSRVRSKYRIT
jgi:Response regulator receiver domain